MRIVYRPGPGPASNPTCAASRRNQRLGSAWSASLIQVSRVEEAWSASLVSSLLDCWELLGLIIDLEHYCDVVCKGN